jgi:tetratricopeptide (TPR) repeat protein
LACALGLAAAAPAPARAAGERPAPARATGETAKGDVHFRRGYQKYQLGELEEALTEFKKAYEASGDPSHLFNVAQCHRRLGQHRAALNAYRAFLREGGDAPMRRQAERFAKEMEQELARGVDKPAPEAAGPAPAARPAPPATGGHVDTTSAAARGAAPERTPGPGALTPAPPPAPGLSLAAAAPPPASPRFYERAWFWGAAGVVVAAGATTALLLTRGGDGARDLCAGSCTGGRFEVPR